ncbi:MAG TPA: MFS transporter [Thermomicrobiales bacterium]|nr:MFS transporter [Thermomicrobiales bacterium]
MAGTIAARQVETGQGAPEPPLNPFVALGHRDFLLLMIGRFVSTIGRQMQTVAIAYQVYQLNHSSLELGLLGLFRILPVIAFSLAGGVLADAVDRRRLMLFTQPALMACSTTLAGLTAFGIVGVGHIYAITMIAAAIGALDMPARQAIIPLLVPRAHLPNALSWNITLMEVGTIAGPALGGVAIAVLGVAGAYSFDAAAFIAPILALILMRVRPGPSAVEGVRGWRAAIEGLRFIRGNAIVVAVMSLDFGATFWGSATVLLPVFADQVLHVGAEQLGLLYSAPAVGSVIGAVVMTLISNRIRKPGWPLLLAVTAYGLSTVGFGLATTMWVCFLFLAGTGLTDTVSMTLRHQILQLLTPDALRGRVTAANQVFVQGGPQLGQLEAGAVAAGFGAPLSVATGGLACVVTVLVIGALVPAIRRYRFSDETSAVP